MATPTFSNKFGVQDGSLARFTWALTTADPTGDSLEWSEWCDVTWTVHDATWGGATLTLQGSNDGTNWFTLTNAAGATALTATSGGSSAGTANGYTSIETPVYVRPKLTTVGVGAAVTVDALKRRQTRMRA